MIEGNGERSEEVSIFPSKMFTDLEDSQSQERFKALMKFQYGFSDEQLECDIEMLRQQERWKAEANFYLLEVTDSEHEYSGRIGQVMFALPTSFIGNRPLYKIGAEELTAGANVENKLALVVKVDLVLVHLAQDGGQYRLLNKFELKEETIEVEDEDGRVGRLLDWQKNDQEGLPFGVYTARFDDVTVEKEDWLMMQEPTWQFRRAETKR